MLKQSKTRNESIYSSNNYTSSFLDVDDLNKDVWMFNYA